MRMVFPAEGGAFFPLVSLVMMKLAGIVPAPRVKPTDSGPSRLLDGRLPRKTGWVSLPSGLNHRDLGVFDAIFARLITSVPSPVEGS